MGHVSDFNGMNTCEEADLTQATTDLISADSLLDLPLNENFMPIYHSFPDDIYRQPHLYASNNLTSFMNNDDDRNGYFDEPLELDLFLDSNFNIDFDPTEVILGNDSRLVQNNTDNTRIETNLCEKNGNTIHIEDDLSGCTSSHVTSLADSESQNKKNPVNETFSSISSNEDKIYPTDSVFCGLESTECKNEEIPKIVIKIKSEPQTENEEFSYVDDSPIANSIKLSSTNNENLSFETVKIKKVKNKHKHKKHKKKSRHKRKHEFDNVKSKTVETNLNSNDSKTNGKTDSYINESLFLNKTVNIHTNNSEIHVLNDPHSNDSSDKLLCVEENIEVHENNYMIDEIKTEPLSDEMDENENVPFVESDSVYIKTEPFCDEMADDDNDLDEPLAIADAVDFQFEFDNSDELSVSSPTSIKKELSEDEFSLQIDASPDENIPCESVVETIKTKPECLALQAFELSNDSENKSTVLNNEPHKSSSASDLIEELNAHHQQVFEEIEVSTTELELEVNDTKSSDKSPKTSHETHISANDIINQNKIVSKHGENDMNSQNHIPMNNIFSSNHHTLAFQSASNHYSNTERLRKISSSSSSVNSKSSTSHRSYRKRRRSSSSSSSCSDQEKFYNRPVKFDPVTQTYCDEFGREIRPSELKYYLHSKSNLRDSQSNNGSSSSSRSKSPRYKSYHRKHHKSRSSSRSHRRRRHSSSRSRSRSRSRSVRYKDNSDRKYRSPSPKHRIKRHYLDVEENMRAYEERRVMYVGDIPPDYTVEQLKERFSRYGPIQTASIKSKFTGDGSLYIFGFVTFINRSDVCEAIERGNENPKWPRFDLNFGGRRRFCNGNYTDLDGKVAESESGWYQTSYRQQPRQEDDFAELLRQEQRRLGMSKK